MVKHRYLRLSLLLVLQLLCSVILFVVFPESSRQPVQTAEVAIAEARKSWIALHEKKRGSSLYSKESTDKFEPYTATLEGDVWVVRGTIPDGFHGETLETRVRRSDGGVHVIDVTR